MVRLTARNALFLGWMVIFLSSCGILPPPATRTVPAQAETAAVSPQPPTLPPTPEITPTLLDTPTPDPSTPSPEETRTGLARTPSGWTLFSNPDFVQGIALYENQLWAATLGGVVVWDLDSRKPTVYTTRDGLAEIQANDIVYCRMPEGRIVVAHPSGTLSAYNIENKRWIRMPITFDDGSTLTDVRTLRCDQASKRLLVGSSDGLGILDWRTNRWKRIGPQEGLKASTIQSIDVIGQTIWLAAGDDSAFMILGSTIFPFNSGSGFPAGGVNDLVVASDQSVWFGYTTGLVHYKDKKWNLYGPRTLASIPFSSVDQVEIGLDNLVWIANAEEGVCPFNIIKLYCSTIYPGTGGASIVDLVVDKNGVAYAATDGKGVLVMDDEQVEFLSLDRKQLISNDLLDITSGPDGKIWVSTSQGINIFDPQQITEPWEVIAPQRNQMAYPRVGVLQPAANGMWLFYDLEAAASFYDGESWLQINQQKGLSGVVMDAAVDLRGFVWMATSHGIHVWDGGTLRVSSTPKSLSNTFYVIEEVDGAIWAGTDSGLLRYQNYQWRVVLPGVSVKSIVSDRKGGLLLGTDTGLIHFDGNQSYLWIINLGDEVLISPRVTSVAWDRLGQLWMGTHGDGLFRFDGKRWDRFGTASGLPSDYVRKVYTDQTGAVWAAMITGKGGGALVRYVP